MGKVAISGVTKQATKSVAKQEDTRFRDEQRRKEVALIRLAHSGVGHTKVAIIAALRENGFAGNPANVERVLALRSEFDHARRRRFINRANARMTHPISSLPAPTGRPAILLPEDIPSKRLTEFREDVVIAYAKRLFRYGAPGGSGFTVQFAASTSEVNYSVNLGTDWTVYRGRFKGWAANVDCHGIRVPLDWRLRVERRGLAVLGGMFTLDALPMEAPQGIHLFAAVWASQGRGYGVKTERGFIAVGAGESCHAGTAENALTGLLRKCNLARKHRASVADLASSVAAFVAKYASCDIYVSLDDARKSGSCEYGIRSWCESVGIDIARVQVSMAELLDGFQRMPLTEVRRAVLHAVREFQGRRRITGPKISNVQV